MKVYMYRAISQYLVFGEIDVYVEHIDINAMLDQSLDGEERYN